ncbi:MAG: pantetheine-phosphate adenylyltransferase [Candidatus Omnitrophota bacterium]
MRRVIYPGTFDPVTNGHIDIIKRAALISDEIVVSVVKSPHKKTLFSFRERLQMVKRVTLGMQNLVVEGFEGLIVDFALKKKASVIVRGLRMISDFEYEFQMALTNRSLNPKVETIFLMPHPEYSYISSRLIKEAAFLGADLRKFLPESVIKPLKEKINENKSKRHK